MQFQQSDMQQYALGLLFHVRRDGCLFDKGTAMGGPSTNTAVKREFFRFFHREIGK